jgi:SAM-dependent MidA family methyltransferase
VRRYTIVDLSGTLRARQQALLAGFGDKVRWVDALPEAIQGVVVGNEVLDAMPVKLLARQGGQAGGVWHERGVALAGRCPGLGRPPHRTAAAGRGRRPTTT